MPSALKSLIICLLLAGFFLTALPALADNITPENYKAPQHANYTILNLEHAIYCETAGYSPINQGCIGYQGNTAFLFDRLPQGGALGALSSTMVALYTNPPISSQSYLADIGTNLGLIQQAQAATSIGGSGDKVLEPVLKLWQVIRNLSYLAFIVIFLIAGFMIMFRQKINPQTVIGIQQALPGLVIGLILVTFSYLISAFIVDLSFVSMKVVSGIFTSSGADNMIGTGNITTTADESNIFTLFGRFIFNGQLIDKVVCPIMGLVGINTCEAFKNGVQIDWTLPLRVITTPISAVLGILVGLIIVIAMVVQMLRLILALVTAYISILVVTVLSPLIILFSSIPGRGGVLSTWWKTLLGNILIFPAVFAAFLFAGMFLANTTSGSFNSTLPLFASLPTSLLPAIIGYGIILATPSIPDMVRNALGVKGPQGFAQASLGGFMGGVGISQGAASQGWKATGLPQSRQSLVESRNKAFVEGRQFTPPPMGASRGPLNRLRHWYLTRGLNELQGRGGGSEGGETQT